MLEIHPLADMVPAMTEEEYQALRADIQQHGLLEPITTYEGKILDGRHRYRACQEIGIEARTVAYEGDSPARYVASLNIHRRHLSISQRAALGVDLLPYYEAEAKARQSEGQERGRDHRGANFVPVQSNRNEEEHRARDDAARDVGVSGTTIYRAAAVKETDPDLFDRVREGEVSVLAAYEQVKEKNVDKSREATAKRHARIAEMNAEGYRASDIARDVGMTESGVRNVLHNMGLPTVEQRIGKAPRLKAEQVMENIISSLLMPDEPYITIQNAWDQLDREKFVQWEQSLTDVLAAPLSLRNRLRKELKGATE